jgi:glutamyl-tRNA synthetase
MKTRFAPSPTGDLHIGGVRTALFNFLFAKHECGEFKLRIEDTDKERNSPESLKSILDGLKWLGLTIDGYPRYQAIHHDRHEAVAHQLIKSGNAYYCYMSNEELESEKKKAIDEKRAFKYDRRWRTGTSELSSDMADVERLHAYMKKNFPEKKPSVRIKMPIDGITEFEDVVRGKITINNSELDDFVILRDDGSPTYLLAVVVDDHDMDISHVIRGEDHITNTFKQIQIFKAMGWDLPIYAHIPLIHGEDGKKLSKRHGAASVLSLKEAGYLPEAVCSYLAGLGWGHATSYMTMDEMIAKFDINQIGSSPSRLDQKKLDNINYHFLKLRDDEFLVVEILKIWAKSKFWTHEFMAYDDIVKKLTFMMPQLKARAKTLVELAKSAEFILKLPEYDDSAKKVLTNNIGIIHLIVNLGLNDVNLKEFSESYNFSLSDVTITVRAALCGSKTSSGSVSIIQTTLGQEEFEYRIKNALDVFGPIAIEET